MFFELLTAVGPGAEKLVVLGGWLPAFLYPRLWGAPPEEIMMTKDLDLGVLDTGGRYFEPRVLDLLLRSPHFKTAPLYPGEENPVQVFWKDPRRKTTVRLDFLMDQNVSDDTRNRFLGSSLSVARLDALDVLLDHRISMVVEHEGASF
jgi:hypothetical protein